MEGGVCGQRTVFCSCSRECEVAVEGSILKMGLSCKTGISPRP
uniref:Uncharacterized protein n=1 Tax=Anguilla anguilla TaxID=7936 RepID=A0A0E9SXR1_ANGAN